MSVCGINHVRWFVAVVFFDVSADGQPLGRIEMTVCDRWVWSRQPHRLSLFSIVYELDWCEGLWFRLCSRSFVPMWCQRLLRTSEPCARERKEWEQVESPSTSRDQLFTVSFQTSCAKVVTSLPETVQVVNPFMGTSSRMRTLFSSTLDQVSCPWPMLDQTPMDPSFSCAPLPLGGLTESTWSLGQSPRVWMWWRKWRALEATLEEHPRRSSLRIVVNYLEYMHHFALYGRFGLYMPCGRKKSSPHLVVTSPFECLKTFPEINSNQLEKMSE